MNAIWGKGLSEEMNVTLGFLLDMGERKQGLIKIAASTCYKVYADGKYSLSGRSVRRTDLLALRKFLLREK